MKKVIITLTVKTTIEAKDDDAYQKALNKVVVKLEKQFENVDVTSEDDIDVVWDQWGDEWEDK